MQITVKAIAPPRGRGPGAFIGTDEVWYKYWTSGKGALVFEKGATYEIETKDDQGKPFVTAARPVAPSPPVGSRAFSNTAAHNDRAIFITGVVGRAMGSGQFGSSDIKLLTLAAAEAFDALQAGQKAPARVAAPSTAQAPPVRAGAPTGWQSDANGPPPPEIGDPGWT